MVAYTIERMEKRLRADAKRNKNKDSSGINKTTNEVPEVSAAVAVPANSNRMVAALQQTTRQNSQQTDPSFSSSPASFGSAGSTPGSGSAASSVTTDLNSSLGRTPKQNKTNNKNPPSPKSPPRSPHVRSSVASGTIASIEAALGCHTQAIGYMQIWKTVRQMQLRDPFLMIRHSIIRLCPVCTLVVLLLLLLTISYLVVLSPDYY